MEATHPSQPTPIKNVQRWDSTSDSESDQDMEKPPYTLEEDTSGTPRIEAKNPSMEDDASDINGGIHNDDISETMLQACNDTQADHDLLSESFGQETEEGDHDL